MERAFQAHMKLLEKFTSFKYLGWLLIEGGYDWTGVASNLGKARKRCTQMKRILGREGEYPRILFFFKGGRTGGVAFRVRDMGTDPPYVVGPGQIPAQGRATAHQEAAEAVGGGYMGVSSAVSSNGGIRFLNRSGYTPQGGIIRLCNILRCDRFWTSVRNLFRLQEPGFIRGGGSRKELT